MAQDPADESSPEEGAVLSPDELDITSEDNVVELDDGRYVISPGDNEPNVSTRSVPDTDPSPRIGERPADRELSAERVHDWIEDRLESADSKYAFDVTARFESEISQRALFSNDVVTTFENLVVWYANHAGTDTPVEDVLGILLLESNLSIRFPPDALRAFATAHGLDETDELGRLYSAALEAGGVRFPPDDD